MNPSRQFRSIIVYVACISGLVALALVVKAGVVAVADRFLHNIPILGGLIRSLELVELFNILIFAILGMGLGVAAEFLPRKWRWSISNVILISLIPLIFLSGALFNYQMWLTHVVERNDISRQEARGLTNEWLEQTVHQKGFWGFYRFTARYTILPTQTEEVWQATSGAERVGETFGRILSQEPKKMTDWLALSTWGLRLFYFLLATVIAVVHFRDGVSQIQSRSRKPERH